MVSLVAFFLLAPAAAKSIGENLKRRSRQAAGFNKQVKTGAVQVQNIHLTMECLELFIADSSPRRWSRIGHERLSKFKCPSIDIKMVLKQNTLCNNSIESNIQQTTHLLTVLEDLGGLLKHSSKYTNR